MDYSTDGLDDWCYWHSHTHQTVVIDDYPKTNVVSNGVAANDLHSLRGNFIVILKVNRILNIPCKRAGESRSRSIFLSLLPSASAMPL